jgi:hypothetical protein
MLRPKACVDLHRPSFINCVRHFSRSGHTVASPPGDRQHKLASECPRSAHLQLQSRTLFGAASIQHTPPPASRSLRHLLCRTAGTSPENFLASRPSPLTSSCDKFTAVPDVPQRTLAYTHSHAVRRSVAQLQANLGTASASTGRPTPDHPIMSPGHCAQCSWQRPLHAKPSTRSQAADAAGRFSDLSVNFRPTPASFRRVCPSGRRPIHGPRQRERAPSFHA